VEEWTTAIPLFHLTRAPQSAFVNSARLHCETRFDHGKGASGADRIYESQAAVHQAEYGRSVGAQISLVTKSGIEQLHGSGYWQHRNDSLNANTFLNNARSLPKPLFRLALLLSSAIRSKAILPDMARVRL
jgi:hypothetical protein